MNIVKANDNNKKKYSRRTLSYVQPIKQLAHTKKFGYTGLKDQFINARRQSYLNSGYNFRRNKLLDITAQNKKLYVRISSQKSSYSRQTMKKAYQNSAAISRRLSQSRFSKRSNSSSSSLSNSQTKKIQGRQKVNHRYRLQTMPVQAIKRQEIQKFSYIFKSQTQNYKPTINIKTRLKKYLQTSNQKIEGQSKPLPQIIKKRSETPKNGNEHTKPIKRDGSLLHMIAEEMITNK